MKTCLTLLLICVCAPFAEGQIRNECRSDSAYAYYYIDSVTKINNGRTYNTYITFNGVILPSTSIILYQIQNSSEWRNYWKEVNLYNIDGLLYETRNYTWDTMNNAWVNAFRSLTTYSATGKETEYRTQVWNNGQWLDGYKLNTTYDNLDRETVAMYSAWDETAYQWITTDRYTTTYDPDGLIMETKNSYWSASGGRWEDRSKSSFTYNTKKQETEKLIMQFNTNRWENDQKYLSTYNDAGMKTEYLFQDWLGYWENSMTDQYVYTTEGCLSTHHNLYDWTNNKWVQHFEDQYLFFKEQTSLPFIYPNPASTLIHVFTNDAMAYAIFDMNGKKVMDGNAIKGLNTISIQQLGSGIYILKTKEKTQKIMVR